MVNLKNDGQLLSKVNYKNGLYSGEVWIAENHKDGAYHGLVEYFNNDGTLKKLKLGMMVI